MHKHARNGDHAGSVMGKIRPRTVLHRAAKRLALTSARLVCLVDELALDPVVGEGKWRTIYDDVLVQVDQVLRQRAIARRQGAARADQEAPRA